MAQVLKSYYDDFGESPILYIFFSKIQRRCDLNYYAITFVDRGSAVIIK